MRQLIPGRAPIVRQRLPFAATLIAAHDDPYGDVARSCRLAGAGARVKSMPAPPATSTPKPALGDWPNGRALLNDLLLKEH